jgi:hypothetical protein
MTVEPLAAGAMTDRSIHSAAPDSHLGRVVPGRRCPVRAATTIQPSPSAPAQYRAVLP